ncbi:hypothetical protein LTR94_023592 [Friedmanniomyces endolithicus]|nr:hypothetical protein LTR94_023592 [Friedmanniomyces endolithicus]
MHDSTSIFPPATPADETVIASSPKAPPSDRGEGEQGDQPLDDPSPSEEMPPIAADDAGASAMAQEAQKPEELT